MIFLITALLGFGFTTALYTIFKKNAMANPDEIDSYMKAAAAGSVSNNVMDSFTVHVNKKVAS